MNDAEGDANSVIRRAIESQLNDNSLPQSSQSGKVLVITANYLQDRLQESFRKLETERKLREACEEQLSGLSAKVNDLKREYSRTLKLREQEVMEYEKEVQHLFESNRRKAELISKARNDWSKLQNAPEILQKKRDQLLNLERNCLVKHVSNKSDFISRNDPIKSMSVDQLRAEVSKTWQLISQQQKLLEKLLDQLHLSLDEEQAVIHDCNGNVMPFPEESDFSNLPSGNIGIETDLKKSNDVKSVSSNTTQHLLEALKSIGSICKNCASKLNSEYSKQKKPSKWLLEDVESPRSTALNNLNARIDKFEQIVKTYDSKKLQDLKEKLSEKINKLETKSRLNC
ncbi:paramyosin, long form-like [Symsagittifera roscoffensis]|uniref:paramyosin, long form-like n=1 Tax=Symsagittifera roscoffensis TaxID=84072 RepID=UPI00307CC145